MYSQEFSNKIKQVRVYAGKILSLHNQIELKGVKTLEIRSVAKKII